MSQTTPIKVKVQYIDLEGGFWGMIDGQKQQYLAVNFPEQMKDNKKVYSITYKELDVVGIQMWGKPIEITSFTT